MEAVKVLSLMFRPYNATRASGKGEQGPLLGKEKSRFG